MARSRRHTRITTTLCDQSSSEFLPLEPRLFLTFSALPSSHRLLSAVTTTASSAVIALPQSPPRIFGGGANGSPAQSTADARSLLRLDQFTADPRFAGINGSGFSSVVLDTGINLSHPFFGPDANADGIADRIRFQYDFADNDTNAADADGHGSNVSSTIASSDSQYPGIAPGAGIIALKVFGDDGSGTFADIEQALQWTIANAAAYNIVSINMSLGDGGNYNLQQSRYGIGDELAALAAMNIIVVAAAGNAFSEFSGQLGVAYPASDPNSLAVGAVYSSNIGGVFYGWDTIANSTAPDRLTPFSQRSLSIPTIFAPGAPVTGAGLGSSTITMHGTSQAAPQISGLVALAQQVAISHLGRRLTLSEFRSLLATSAATIVDGDDEDDNVANTGQSFRRADMLALAEAILNLSPAPPPNNVAPTLTSIATLGGGRPNRFGIATYSLLRAAGNESDANNDLIRFRVAAVSTGLLLLNGVAVVPGQSLVGPGDKLFWLPPQNATGVLPAFTLRAFDGYASSASPVTVRVQVSSRLALRQHAGGNSMNPQNLSLTQTTTPLISAPIVTSTPSFISTSTPNRALATASEPDRALRWPTTPDDIAARLMISDSRAARLLAA